MTPYPHHYSVRARGSTIGTVAVSTAKLPEITTAPPPEFDGPGNAWSPEALLVAAVADCFILTFRGVARAAKFPWESLECEAEGILDRVANVAQFKHFTTRATLAVAPGTDHAQAKAILERAEKLCLVGNSLRAERTLEMRVMDFAQSAVAV